MERFCGDCIDLRSLELLFLVEDLTGEESRRFAGDEDRVAAGDSRSAKEFARGSKELESS